MNVITNVELLDQVAGGLAGSDDPTLYQASGDEALGGASINAPDCPPGYTGVVLRSQTITTSGLGITIGASATLVVPTVSVQGAAPSTTIANAQTQACLPDLQNANNNSAGMCGRTSNGGCDGWTQPGGESLPT